MTNIKLAKLIIINIIPKYLMMRFLFDSILPLKPNEIIINPKLKHVINMLAKNESIIIEIEGFIKIYVKPACNKNNIEKIREQLRNVE